MPAVQKISSFLMFDGPVDEPAKFYVSVFPNSEVVHHDGMLQAGTLPGSRTSEPLGNVISPLCHSRRDNRS